MTDNVLFSVTYERIEKEYHRLGHTLGYRFLLGSRKNLCPETDILFLGLNPGGRRVRVDHPNSSCENGPAFLKETWGAGSGPGNAPLQIQVQKMFFDLAEIWPGNRDFQQLMNDSLLAYFVPFRSPSAATLIRKAESMSFARSLWTDILAVINPRLIITMDRDSFTYVLSIIEQRDRVKPVQYRSLTGWGRISAELAVFGAGNRRLSVLRFPHLSRFRIFGRHQSKPLTDALFSKAVKYSGVCNG